MELVTKRDMEDAERLGEAMGFNLEHEWPEMVRRISVGCETEDEMKSGMSPLMVMAGAVALASSIAGSDMISVARESAPSGPPPEGARPSRNPTTGKRYKPNGKRETERRRRQLARVANQ